VAGSPLAGQVDETRIAIGGHSLGGYLATFAAVKAQSEGPKLSALLLLDPSDERFGTLTEDSSLSQTPLVKVPTIDLASEENQHPIMCNMDDGTDCTLVANQQYKALSAATPKLGLKVVGSVHEDIEDPSTIGTEDSVRNLRLFQRYGMAWAEFWLAHDCRAGDYLGGLRSRQDQKAGLIELFPGGVQSPRC
jgi:pimeloyl-ACP methyl ester carboxylesterase